MVNEVLERKIIEIIATDRIDIPISSMSGKLKRKKPKLAQDVDLTDYQGKFKGKRVYARIEEDEVMKARGMKEGIERYCEKFLREGKILRGMIEEERKLREIHLYFGINEGCRLTADDYMNVMTGMGFTETTARALYPELMDISRNLSRQKKRADEERSIMVASTL